LTITWNETKRQITLAERNLEFCGCRAGVRRPHDDVAGRAQGLRRAALHHRWLAAREVVVVWSPRDSGRRIISMRCGHGVEEEYWLEQMD